MINKMNQVLGKDDKILELCEKERDLNRDSNAYISYLLNELWKKPKLVASIIENTDINVIKDDLAPFFAHNFYENILSYDCIEDNLLYVLTLLMQSEIQNLNDTNQKNKFLIDTPCGIMLEKIYEKVEIQMYLNKITKNAIENLEKNYSNYKIDYNLKKIAIEFDWETSIEINNDKNRIEDFHQKYIPNLDESALEKLIEENKSNKNMFDFLNSKLSLFSNNIKHQFSNKNFLSFCYGFKNSDELLNLYINKFYIAIDFIDQMINDILKDIYSIPDSLKKICRIISELIIQKFPTINTFDKNAFISKFFIDKLLIPFLSNSNIFSFMSENTIVNLKFICNILKKCIIGDFFSSDDSEFSFTPFNWFTIYNMEKIFNLYQNLTKVQLAPYLEKLIFNKLSPDFEYDYFNENTDKKFNMKSILYNINQIHNLVTTINKNKSIILQENKDKRIKISIERLAKYFENIIKDEKKNINKFNKRKSNKIEKKKEEEELPKQKIKCSLIMELCVNKKYNRYLQIRHHDCFYIKPNKELKEENDNIKFKNYFVYLLDNIKQLEKSDFNENEIDSIEKIITKLNYILSNLDINYDDFSKLSTEYILEYLKKIPEDSRENYLIKISNELEKEINESIRDTDFEIFAIINKILKSNKRYQENNRKYCEILEKYEENNEVRKIMKELFIPIDVIIEYKNNLISKFEIKSSSYKEKDKEKEDKIKKYEKSNKTKLCLNIEDFIKIFPDFTEYQTDNNYDKDIFDIQENIGASKILNRYNDIIKEKLKIHNIKNIEEISDKIYDYIIEKIYDKCYPKKPYKKDKDILNNCISLKWVEPQHIIHEKYLVFLGKSGKDIENNIKLFIQEKSMEKKNIIAKNITNSIELLFKFDEISKSYYGFGVDQLLPILSYYTIKAEPSMLYSTIRFMYLYNKNKYNQFLLEPWRMISEFIQNITYNNLINITQEDFENKCNEALKKIK